MAELLNTFCLAALVFLSLPLPLFASAALEVRASARRFLLPWVWGHAIGSGALGILMIATPAPPLLLLAAAAAVFLACGMQMSRGVARSHGVT